MHRVDMLNQVLLRVELHFAEDAVGMLPFHVRIKLSLRNESLWKSIICLALITPETQRTVYTVFVLAECACRVVAGLTCFLRIRINEATRERSKTLVVGPYMALKSLVLAECLVAWRILGASESLVALMRCLMSSQSRRCKEALRAALPVTNMIPFVGMCAFNMLLQMLLFQICFVASLPVADKWSLIGM